MWRKNDAPTNSEGDFGQAEGEYNLERDRIYIAQLLLERSADVNVQDRDSATPLHLASYNGRVAIARVLLDGGAAANSKGNQGGTPLHSVAEGRCLFTNDDGIRIAQLLLKRGADVNAQKGGGRTPLHLACHFGKVKMVLTLLNAGANPIASDAQGQSPLHLVSRGQYPHQGNGVRIVQLLLEHSVDVNAQDKNHTTPLDLATYHGKTEIATWLLDYGGKTNASAKTDQLPTPRQPRLEGPQFDDEHCLPEPL